MPYRYSILCAALAVLTPIVAHAADYETILVDKGQSVDVYWEVNLAGRVYVAADINGQPACLDYWWIVWPFTQVRSLGRQCGRAVFALPSLGDWAIGGKLRAGGADAPTRLRATSQESIAYKFPEISF